MNKHTRLLKKFLPLLFVMATLPFIASAQPVSYSATGVLDNISDLLSSILPILVSVAVLYFIYGVITYLIGYDEESKKAGRDKVIYGIVGLAVIVSVWGLVAILTTTLGVGQDAAPNTQISELGVVQGDTSSCPNLGVGKPKVSDAIDYVTCIIGKSVIPLIFALALVTFLWGAVNFFIINSDEEAKREQGKQFMLWGIVALAVMLSVWGLVEILTSTFGVDVMFLPGVNPNP